ncbi:MAG TPA: ribosome biogenesis GTPase Der [Clostridiales bacterium]|nr:MAG: ribosome biogenesis GTPase Der [Clostridiales bacterium GWD2_32_59]HAN10240.1 ribosome biogenesis GTPase Der [Clostridiales bacterium]
MMKPIVAIVGRPNVGKSTLFNRLVGDMVAIVDDTPGVTRDRIYGESEWLGRDFIVIDTGGIEPKTDDIILKQMKRQAQIAIETADVIIFVVDVKQGIVDADFGVATILRKSNKPIVLVVNKIDDMSNTTGLYEFFNLGLGDPMPVSAGQKLGLGDMLERVAEHFPNEQEEDFDEEVMKIAVVGKPNVGKSSLINKILKEDRLIVSEIAGTTRDAIDTYAKIGEDKYLFIDTAGIRRRSKVTEAIERYSVIRAMAAIERADIAILLIDATEGVSEQDTKIIGMAHDKGKGIIIAVNKWDAVEKDDKTMNKFLKEIDREFAFMSYSKKVFISALTGQRIDKLFETIKEIHKNQTKRISTGMLNEVLVEALAMNEPPNDKGRRLKIFYGTQATIKPPTFVLFVNDRELAHFSYIRYIENRFRDSFGFDGTPVHFIIRQRGENE